MTAVQERLVLEFDGEDVQQVVVKITKAGDGLSDGLRVRPVDLAIGDEVYYVLKGTVAQVNHKRDKKTEQIVRTYVVETVQITMTDEAKVSKILSQSALALEKARAEMVGQGALDDPNEG